MKETSIKEILPLLVSVIIASWFLSVMPHKVKMSVASLINRTIFAPFSAISNAYWSIKSASANIHHLKHTIAQMSMEIQLLHEAQTENIRLRQLLQLKEQTNLDLVIAQVIGIPDPRKLGFLIVACGIEQGVKEGMPVITHEGVIGKVTNVSHNLSTIQTLADPGFSISAMDSRSRVTGIISMEDDGMLTMQNIPSGADIVVGDKIITSGYGGIFPKGLTIGTVIRVLDKPDKLFKYVIVHPAVSLTNIEEVFIMRTIPTDSVGKI